GLGLLEMRRRGGLGRELLRELTNDEVLGPALHETTGGDVPEGGGAAVAEDHLIALGEGEQLGEALTDSRDLILHRRLTVRGAQHGAGDRLQRVHLLRPDAGRTGTEATVRGKQVLGDRQGAQSVGACSAGSRHSGSPLEGGPRTSGLWAPTSIV